MKPASTKALVRAAIIAALYVALTLILAPISFGPVQVRASEALAVLPVLFPEAIPALYIGCLIANFGSPLGPIDVFGGSAVTLLAAIATYRLRRNIRLALLPPVVFNALLVSIYVHTFMGWPYWLTVLSIGAGQTVAVYGLGLLLLSYLRRQAKT
jgi:uncharacterized membrane protein